MYNLGLEKTEIWDLIADIHQIMEEARRFHKNVYFCFIDYFETFVWITTNCGKFSKWLDYQTTLPVSWETNMWYKKQQLEPDMEQLTDSKLRKVPQGYILSFCLFKTYM